MNGTTVQSARVVMGAVAPVPWRSQAGRSRRSPGKTITEETAAAAADAALRDARPLSQNAYKIQVAKTAVKRAILQRRRTSHGRGPWKPGAARHMESLTSPKITVGVHCLQAPHQEHVRAVRSWTRRRRRSMITYEPSAYWCVHDADRLRARTASPSGRTSAAAAAAAAGL